MARQDKSPGCQRYQEIMIRSRRPVFPARSTCQWKKFPRSSWRDHFLTLISAVIMNLIISLYQERDDLHVARKIIAPKILANAIHRTLLLNSFSLLITSSLDRSIKPVLSHVDLVVNLVDWWGSISANTCPRYNGNDTFRLSDSLACHSFLRRSAQPGGDGVGR